jgi:hypothetical protein
MRDEQDWSSVFRHLARADDGYIRRIIEGPVLLRLDTLHNAALSKPTDASAHETKMFDRVPPVDYVEGNEARRSIVAAHS